MQRNEFIHQLVLGRRLADLNRDGFAIVTDAVALAKEVEKVAPFDKAPQHGTYDADL